MKPHLSRWAAQGVMALAIALGVWLFGLNALDQIRRLAFYLAQGLGFADPGCTTGYCDFTMFWLAGALARHGEAAILYDHARYAAAAARMFPDKTGYWPFVYPPTVLLPAAAVSLVPLAPGYYVFSALLLAPSVWLLRRAGLAWWCIGAGLCGPAAMWNLYLGQFGLLCGALLVAGLAGMGARPLRAGFSLALLCIKPQYALLVPVAVLASRRWRVMLVGIAGLVLLLALSLVFGTGAWAAYLGPGRAASAALLAQPFGPGYQMMGISMFWMARSLGASLGLAAATQAAATLAAALGTWRLWRAPDSGPIRRLAITVLLTLLASPYGFTDDLAIYSVLLPALARRGAAWRNAGLAWLWVLPALAPKLVPVFGFLPTPLLLLSALALAWQKADSPAAYKSAPTLQAAPSPP
jgi:hypothetical protein